MNPSIRLPGEFVRDRLARDLPCGAVAWKGRQAVVSAPLDTLRDMADDADYQARETDNEDRSLKRSAAAAHARLIEFIAASTPLEPGEIDPEAEHEDRMRLAFLEQKFRRR